MPALTPFEKRREARELYDEQCLFSHEGKAVHLRLRDASRRGIGVYSRETLSEGEKGFLLAKLPSEGRSGRYEATVCWCQPCDDDERKAYPFRMGFRIIGGTQPPAEKALRPRVATAAPEPEQAVRRVKGSLLVDLAKVIRRNHDKPWHKYLTMDDMKIITDMIIPAAWYPLDTFRHAGKAVFEVFGYGHNETLRQWGHGMAERIPTQMYQQFFNKNNPKLAIQNYVNVNGRVMDFLKIRYADGGDTQARIRFQGDAGLRRRFPELELYGIVIGGVAEKLAERNGANEARSQVETPADEGDILAVKVSWS